MYEFQLPSQQPHSHLPVISPIHTKPLTISSSFLVMVVVPRPFVLRRTRTSGPVKVALLTS